MQPRTNRSFIVYTQSRVVPLLTVSNVELSCPTLSPAVFTENRLVIKERDDVLAENVLKACRAHPGRPVVAVLGLLHCNGVADILRNSDGFRGAVFGAGGE